MRLESFGWERLGVHARRVRTLYMEPGHIPISPTIYLHIHAMCDSPLLPGLKKIYIPYNADFDLSSALFLTSQSTLNMVHMYGDPISDWEFFIPFLSSLYIKSPGLSHLALHETVLSFSAGVELICRFKELQSFEIRLRYFSFPLHLLHKLGQLPHLLHLIIDAGDISSSKDIQPHKTPISINNSNFKQLRHLQIFGKTTIIHCILNELKGLTNLSALKIDQNSNWYTEDSTSLTRTWKSFFEVISTFSALEDIEISIDSNRQQVTKVPISASSLAPLFRLDNLKSFVINDSILLSGSDEDFRLLAEGFPKLKKFVIPRSLLSDGRTLACLYYLSRECPDLRQITITLLSNISDNLNAIKKLPHPIVRNYLHPLEKLYIDSDFGQLQPIELVQVARFLDLIFPNLFTLETDKSKLTESANWAGIHELRSALRDARINPSSVSDI